MAKLASAGMDGQKAYMQYIANGLVKQEMQTATATRMIALVLEDGGQKVSSMIDPTNAAARNSDRIKSIPSLIGSPTMLSPDAPQYGQAIFV